MAELITKEELGERLKLRPDTIKRWTLQGIIPCLRLSGKVVRYDPDQVTDALRQHAAIREGKRCLP